MVKTWVLDTETKGTGAEMVPLEKVLDRGARPSERISVARRRRGRRPDPTPEPTRPLRFRVLDVMTQEVLADGADTRTAVEALRRMRSTVDVHVHVWDEPAQRWRLITQREQAALWNLR